MDLDSGINGLGYIGQNSTKKRPIKRALDWWESARFQAFFCLRVFLLPSRIHDRPSASNARRSAARPFTAVNVNSLKGILELANKLKEH